MNAYLHRIRHSLTADPGRAKIILGIFFGVGIAGFSFPSSREYFMELTPYAILLSLGFLLIYHDPAPDRKTILFFISVAVITWLIEAAGVATGYIFGTYSYGEGLGIRILKTPLLIGINWFMMIYTSYCIAGRISSNHVAGVISASALMVLYDFIMENVSHYLDMWSFQDGMPPLRNYISWFLIAVILHITLRLLRITFRNRLAPFVFFVQAAFFLILVIILRLSR